MILLFNDNDRMAGLEIKNFFFNKKIGFFKFESDFFYLN